MGLGLGLGLRRGRAAIGWLVAIGLVVLAGGGLGCAATRIPSEELADRPIAVLYWDDESSRRRKEIFEQAQVNRGDVRGSGAVGVASVEGLARYLGAKPATAAELSGRLKQFPGRLHLLDPRTGEIERVQAAAPGARPMAWSADHRDLLFASDRVTGNWQLFIYNRESREVRPLTVGTEARFVADWSDDDRFLYTGLSRSGRQLRARVYVTGRGGRDPQPLVEGIHSEVRFTPNGEQAILVRPDSRASTARRVRPPMIVVKSLVDSEAEERVVARGRNPAVAANGSWVVYSAAVADGWRLVRVRPDGGGRARVGKGTKDESMPAISPDGRHVAYVAEEGDFERLFVKRMDGSGDRVLLDKGSVAWPVW